MNHRYIDEHAVAERYVKHALPSAERAVFEAHLVDCQECADRLLLAQMFHARNGHAPASMAVVQVASQPHDEETTPTPIRLVRFGWQSAVTFFALAILLGTLVCAAIAYLLTGR